MKGALSINHPLRKYTNVAADCFFKTAICTVEHIKPPQLKNRMVDDNTSWELWCAHTHMHTPTHTHKYPAIRGSFKFVRANAIVEM